MNKHTDAAPDLLDVAKRLNDAVGFFVAALPTNHAVAKDLIGLRDLARAAIAKAEGEARKMASNADVVAQAGGKPGDVPSGYDRSDWNA